MSETKEFSKMTSSEQKDLVQKIGVVLKENGLEDTDVKVVTQDVCNLSNNTVDKDVWLIINKEMPASQAEIAKTVNEAIKPLVDGIKGCDISISSKVGAGDPYSTITDVMPIKEEEKINLEHKEGEVWLVDFWATWCPPCQKPMAHNQEMLEKRAADWGSNVRIIGISIDQTKDVVVKHCEEKKWMSIEHYHRHESKCSDVYGVRGVPHVMLIDTKGNIAFMGHPANRPDLEKDFDALLKGETLTGEGCGSSAAKAEEDPKAAADIPEGFKALDMAEVSDEINNLHEVFVGFTKDEELKNSTKECGRTFCVLVLEMRYSPKTGNFIGKYDNHRVLHGLKEHVDKITAAFDEKVKGSFEIISKVRSTAKGCVCEHKGHKLTYQKTNQYGERGNYSGVSCNACGKDVTSDQIKLGFYVCLICQDDYHKECVIRDEALEAEYDNKKEEAETKKEEEVETKKEGAE